MEKRYQAFVSSTFRDLREERQAVIQALLELDCIPAGMELFPASDETAWEVIKRVIDGCDYYVVVVGGRYGSVDADGISYTEREYDYAVKLGMPVLGFVHEEPEQIPAGKSELGQEAQQRLAEFRKKVMGRVCKSYKNADDLGGKVSRAMIQAIKLDPREGWVRGRFASSPERINELRARIDELERQLEDARIRPPVEAEGLAQGEDPMGFSYALHGTWKKFETTWDEVIDYLGPLMLSEADEAQLKTALRQRIAAGEGVEPVYIRLSEDDFQTIKVQLLALGLIKQSDRKRTVADKATYWTLTPFGRHHLMTLRAIRRP